MALTSGYRAQDAALRRAILSQFPLLNIGYSRQRDTSGILSNGLAATVTLPIFNRNRGEIAIQSATRLRLAAEYRARLDQAVADVAGVRRDLAADRTTLARLQAELPGLNAVAEQARLALARRDLDSGGYLALEQTVIKQQTAIADLRLAAALAAIGLDTVLFLPPSGARAS